MCECDAIVLERIMMLLSIWHVYLAPCPLNTRIPLCYESVNNVCDVRNYGKKM